MPTAQDRDSDAVSVTIAAITARLAARHDGLTVLRAVTDACASVLSADATGVLVVDPRGGLEVIAASDERTRFVELPQAQTREGPDPGAERTAGRAARGADAHTLNDRAHLGHAVGVIAGTLAAMPEAARAMLAATSAATGRSLRELAHAVTSGTLAPADLHDAPATGRG